jgi:phage tail protein X
MSAAALLLALSWPVIRANIGSKPAPSPQIREATAAPPAAPISQQTSLASTNASDAGASLITTTTEKISDPTNQLVPWDKGIPSPVRAGLLQGSRLVRVNPNESLIRISFNNFGRFDTEILEEILALNPGITDPDYIQSGQELVIPSVAHDSKAPQSVAGQNPRTSSTEVEKP